jgi:hypothetical protein
MQTVEEGEGLIEKLGTDLRYQQGSRLAEVAGKGQSKRQRAEWNVSGMRAHSTYRATQLFLKVGQAGVLHFRHQKEATRAVSGDECECCKCREPRNEGGHNQGSPREVGWCWGKCDGIHSLSSASI